MKEYVVQIQHNFKEVKRIIISVPEFEGFRTVKVFKVKGELDYAFIITALQEYYLSKEQIIEIVNDIKREFEEFNKQYKKSNKTKIEELYEILNECGLERGD